MPTSLPSVHTAKCLTVNGVCSERFELSMWHCASLDLSVQPVTCLRRYASGVMACTTVIGTVQPGDLLFLFLGKVLPFDAAIGTLPNAATSSDRALLHASRLETR